MSDSDYKVVNGVIVSPGKFEGQPEWVVTLWELIMNGMADASTHDGSFAIDAFKLDKDTADICGMVPQDNAYIALWTDDRGFVSWMLMSQAELDACEPEDCDLNDLGDFDNIPTRDYAIPFDDIEEYGGESDHY